MDIGSIDSGNIKIKVLTTNTASITLLTDDKFEGKVVQPEAAANRVLGEHGLSMSFEVKNGDENHLYLLDAGSLTQAIIENSKQLGINLNDVEKLVLSHGHFDHFGGLTAVIPEMKEGSEIYLNPLCFQQTQLVLTKTGEELPAEGLATTIKKYRKEGKLAIEKKLPLLNKNMILNLAEQNGVKIIETTESQNIHNGIITSGEIEIFDESEITKGMYLVKSRKDFEKHTFRDETSIYINIKNEGLAVITGCGHVGIVNTIKHAKKLTGIDKIYAVIGGFHKEWESKEDIEKSVEYIESLNPRITCGMHCTGFEFNKVMSRHPSHTLGVTGTEFNL